MDEQIVDKVLERLDTIGQTIANGAEAGFEVLVRQAVITGITNIVWGVILLALAVAGALHIKRSHKNFAENKLGKKINSFSEYDWDDWLMGQGHFFTITISVMLAAFGSGMITVGVKMVFNPAYYAIHEILESIG